MRMASCQRGVLAKKLDEEKKQSKEVSEFDTSTKLKKKQPKRKKETKGI